MESQIKARLPRELKERFYACLPEGYSANAVIVGLIEAYCECADVMGFKEDPRIPAAARRYRDGEKE